MSKKGSRLVDVVLSVVSCGSASTRAKPSPPTRHSAGLEVPGTQGARQSRLKVRWADFPFANGPYGRTS